jgi:hypothetical protein
MEQTAINGFYRPVFLLQISHLLHYRQIPRLLRSFKVSSSLFCHKSAVVCIGTVFSPVQLVDVSTSLINHATIVSIDKILDSS